MSARVMNCLEVLAPRVEQYSIDEMFLNLTGLEHCMGLDDFGRQLRQHVYDCTRLTIGVGAGPTKTLAKSAQWASKEWKQFRGVLALIRGNPQRTRKLLSLQPVEEIWGVGNLIARKLNMLGIKTALDLALTNPTFIRKNFSVVLERTVRELNGESCLSLEEAPPTKQQIVCSRSFGVKIKEYESLRRLSVSTLSGPLKSCVKSTSIAGIFPFPSKRLRSPLKSLTPTQDTRDIIAAATTTLERIWRDGHRYAKAGVMLNDFTGSGVSQLQLFDERPYSAELMKVLDGINNSGLGKVWFAGRGIAPEWQMKREMLSPAYTTRWSDIPAAKLA